MRNKKDGVNLRRRGHNKKRCKICQLKPSIRAEVEKMMEEVKNTFIGEYGILAWDEILKETTRIRKEQAAARAQAAKEQEALMENVIVYGSAFLLFVVVVICGLLVAISFVH